MKRRHGWMHCLSIGLLAVLAPALACAQANPPDRTRVTQSRPAPAPTRAIEAVVPDIRQSLADQMPVGSEKLASYKTEPGWHYAFGSTDVRLMRNGTCVVTCSIDVQSHVQTGYLTFRTARHDATSGTSESDDGWAMDVPVPISQGSASSTFAWTMKGGQAYRFGCRSLADRGFLGIDIYPNVAWNCR